MGSDVIKLIVKLLSTVFYIPVHNFYSMNYAAIIRRQDKIHIATNPPVIALGLILVKMFALQLSQIAKVC